MAWANWVYLPEVPFEDHRITSPAGSPEALDAAIAEGADAVYLGLKNFNARMRTSNFAYSHVRGRPKGSAPPESPLVCDREYGF